MERRGRRRHIVSTHTKNTNYTQLNSSCPVWCRRIGKWKSKRVGRRGLVVLTQLAWWKWVSRVYIWFVLIRYMCFVFRPSLRHTWVLEWSHITLSCNHIIIIATRRVEIDIEHINIDRYSRRTSVPNSISSRFIYVIRDAGYLICPREHSAAAADGLDPK